MAKITFNTTDDQSLTLEAESGSLMQLAVDNGVAGIDGDCGGVCSCATCHVFVNEEQMALVGEASEIEADMLELADNLAPNSRLCCQIAVSDAIDGLIVTVAQ